jgi:hypothetical protein
MPVSSYWFGHTTLIRKNLVKVGAGGAGWTASLSETLSDAVVHYKVASEITPIPIYRRMGNVSAYLSIGGIASSFGVDVSNSAFVSAGVSFQMVVYLLEKTTLLERPVFTSSDYLNSGITIGRTYSIDGQLETHINHFSQIPGVYEYATTAYDPIADETFNLALPGLICKIGFGWVYAAYAEYQTHVLSAEVALSENIDLLAPA